MIRKMVILIFALLLAVSMVSCNTAATLGTSANPVISAGIVCSVIQTAEAAGPTNKTAADSDMVLPAAQIELSGTALSPSAYKPPRPSTAIIIFTFDDGTVSDYLLAYPILKKYGIMGTSYINTKYVDQKVRGRLSWKQIKKMSKYGWVFGAHTCTHQRMTKLTTKEIKHDCEAVNRSFIKQGLTPPVIMAYPFGSYNKRIIKAIQSYYKQARLANYQTDYVDPVNTNPYMIPSVSADMQSTSTLKKTMLLVDKACEESAIIVFRTHMLYKEHPFDTVKRNSRVRGGSTPQTDSRLFAKLVKYCVDKGCTFMTMTELMNYMEALKK